jgi:ADP-ribose pyrophosphatase
MIAEWNVLGRQPALDFGLFKVWRKQARSPRTGLVSEVLSLDFPDWVLVVPVTPAKEIVMVRQYRHGNEEICLELPGGLVDTHDHTPAAAAQRELIEETGFKSERILKLGECFPQPAILSNRCFFYLATDVEKIRAPVLDAAEDIEIVRVPSEHVFEKIETGEITNGMVQLAISHYRTQKREAI